MWRDVCLHNRTAILAALGHLQDGLDVLVEAIDKQDGDKLYDYFEIAKQTRDTKILGASARANQEDQV